MYNKEEDYHNNDTRFYGNNDHNEKSSDEDEVDENNEDEEDDEENDDNGRFYFIACEDLPDEWNFFDIIVDTQTRVQYLQDEEGYSLTPLIDSNGKPILYTGNFDE